jgi:hypothetical protein
MSRRIPASLPVDDVLVVKCERLIRKMNRSERKRVHRTLLAASRSASDKILTDNRNIVATRLTWDAYVSLINICDEHSTDISTFLRTAIHNAIKEHQ